MPTAFATCLISILLLLASTRLPAMIEDSWSEPQPVRRAAWLEGRDFIYNSESFLHRLSYRHIQDTPGPAEAGVRGTAGSTRSAEFFTDIALRVNLPFDNRKQAFHLAMYRQEDFDGRFDRQLVGISHQLTDTWQLRVQSDVRADKAESDIWFEAIQNRGPWRLRLVTILPDAYFNSKSALDDEYLTKPRSYYWQAQWQGDQTIASISVNHSPLAIFQDSVSSILVTNRQTRGHALLGHSAGPLTFRLQAAAETTWREFEYSRGLDEFVRRMHSLDTSVTHEDLALQPELGLYHLRLQEDGRLSATGPSGYRSRDEVMAYLGLSIRQSPRSHWQPTLYLSRSSLRRRLMDDGSPDRDERHWLGKINIPWRYEAAANGATLTVAFSVRLHKAAFGGGNVQLHWPL